MKLGYLILAHESYDELSILLKTLSSFSDDCIIVHHDKKSNHKEDLVRIKNDYSHVNFIDSINVEWGEDSIVTATLNGMKIAQNNDIDYLVLLSGSCMPIKSRDDLIQYLSDDDRDYIECHDLNKGNWVKAGLEKERWEHYNLFNWRKDPVYFSISHKIQDLFKIKRKFPGGINPVMGSQWWCLKKDTIKNILEFSESNKVGRFLKKTWIPDEFYIQSVANHFTDPTGLGEIMMYYRFNDVGIPKVFTFTDIPELLSATNNKFFARKIDLADNNLTNYLSNVYRGTSCHEDGVSLKAEVVKPSFQKYLIASFDFKKISPLYVFVANEKVKEKILEIYDNMKSEFSYCRFYDELFSAKSINYGLESEHPYYTASDINIRDYDLQYFTMNILDNGFVNVFIMNIDDFDKVNYVIQDHPMVKYIIVNDINEYDIESLKESAKITKYLKSNGIDVLLETDLDTLENKIRSEILANPIANICKKW
ncbi:beta-1,6-N-acetylglucosaminyltransferase [Yersinia enterocolitica]|nr:beta-1,6-N-acetylglucosaminyltransferase [Citrobacter freundii]EKN3735303.1 hypothetical protein [Yersinia enterocolitica]MBD9979344.1 beta-1,6-N-acetylglucosaminyltransferase [Citrobacter braakii]QMA45874.1 hypothetical protein HV030_04220 [Citrobacter freundii]HCB1910132.1 hypothetical protein [Citrobacter amalonaticus]